MKNILLALFSVLTLGVNAQTMPYAFSVLNEPYVPLTDSVSVNAGAIWDDNEYIMPIGFLFQVIDEAWSQVITTAPGALIVGDVMADSIHLLLPVLEDICDVGLSGKISGSPISYKLEGELGQQIFKLEWSNVGFYGEYAQSNTNFNTFSFQMWLYEGTNVIEYRFGPSAIKGGNFFQFGGPMTGICEDFANGKKNAWQNFWYTSADPANPSIQLLDPNNFGEAVPLNSLPVEGTVYHFGPLFVDQDELGKNTFKAFPSIAQDHIWVQTPEHAAKSIRVMDISGKLIEQYNVQSSVQKLDISQWPSGIYFVQVDQMGIQKFIKK